MNSCPGCGTGHWKVKTGFGKGVKATVMARGGTKIRVHQGKAVHGRLAYFQRGNSASKGRLSGLLELRLDARIPTCATFRPGRGTACSSARRLLSDLRAWEVQSGSVCRGGRVTNLFWGVRGKRTCFSRAADVLVAFALKGGARRRSEENGFCLQAALWPCGLHGHLIFAGK